MSDVSDEVLQLEESMSLDEPEGAIALLVVLTPQKTPEIPKSWEVTFAKRKHSISETEPWIRAHAAHSRRQVQKTKITMVKET